MATSTAAAAAPANALITTQSGSELQIILHPLVLLTISDYITRHTLRGQTSPIVGGLLGLQNARDITIEHAFDVDMIPNEDVPETYKLNGVHFNQRLDMMKQVHQDRHLELVGWYTLLPSTGPSPETLATQQVFQIYNESAVLLGFHPDHALDKSSGSKLPLTVYESIWEVKSQSSQPESAAEDKTMADGGEGKGPQLKFRELPYSVEVDETEMISMNYIAGSSGGTTTTAKDDKPSRSIESNGKGKRRLVEKGSGEAQPPAVVTSSYTTEEEEMLAFLTTKANATRMLQSRIRLIKTYLEKLPPSVAASEGRPEDVNMDVDNTAPSLAVLRQIQALVSRLDLIVPSDQEAFEKELREGVNDASLVALMDQIARSVAEARETGKKFHVVDQARGTGSRRGIAFSGGSDFADLGVGDIMM